MSTLSSSSDLATVVASYKDNGSYEEDASPTKAKAFITACRLLLLMLPEKSQQSVRQAADFGVNLSMINGEMDQARTWLSTNDTSGQAAGRVTHTSFRNFRG